MDKKFITFLCTIMLLQNVLEMQCNDISSLKKYFYFSFFLLFKNVELNLYRFLKDYFLPRFLFRHTFIDDLLKVPSDFL